MTKLPLVCNTSPLLYLGRIGQVEVLPALFEPVYVPEAVLLELDAGRLLRADTPDPRGWDWLKPVMVARSDLDNLPLNRLGSGERAVIAYARAHHPTCVVALDDRQARLLAAQLGLLRVGTTGLLVQAKRTGLIPSLRPLLAAVREQGFHLSADVYDEALRLANELTRGS